MCRTGSGTAAAAPRLDEALSPFLDTERVTVTVEMTRGELRALVDDPIMLLGRDPMAWYVTAKQGGIRALAEASGERLHGVF